jgi:hypothetical protein
MFWLQKMLLVANKDGLIGAFSKLSTNLLEWIAARTVVQMAKLMVI